MKIDRHNYEEFFILYWDDELAAAEKQAVENFVKQNADLREEFEILGEARFAPDDHVQLEQKEFLLNNSFINITNYEEQLLNYIDDEITARERKEVEKFVRQYPDVQKELALFQKTKLQPETGISFPDKSVLYRREEKVRIISMTWFRVAVAAALIIIAGLTVFQFVKPGKNTDPTPLVKTDPQKNTPVNKQVDISKEQTGKEQPQDIANVNDKSKAQSKETAIDKIPVEENAIASNLTDESRNKNNLPARRNDVIVTDLNEPIKEAVVYTIPEKAGAVPITDSRPINIPFTNPDVTNKPELALYIPEAEEKEKDGGGLKEFLRKTTRVFERRTKMQTTTEDNKLLVGAFAVSLK